MIRRLQELRHTEQVQRAYALNCGEGATVSYELQLRVLREFGLADGATELLQVSRKQGLERERDGYGWYSNRDGRKLRPQKCSRSWATSGRLVLKKC